ncbi:hypothetical protein CfE428DRAFT_6015 [Chthoniobacter flavus Ellin428]|uniref:Uncharacterized protein n=1 Tax=Chthoniobacter flavus Ellin428 TaxID=497964 RepID=B4DAS4_9BACT|nr:hypothetical protein CfE428DRAFT_6015 [Chthoniobacter flavus Ellin428]TCO92751.1 hypothetical protein EV701_10528 [Chthoniobacter flavus]
MMPEYPPVLTLKEQATRVGLSVRTMAQWREWKIATVRFNDQNQLAGAEPRVAGPFTATKDSDASPQSASDQSPIGPERGAE